LPREGLVNLGIFLPTWVGDACMATPAMRSLRNHLGPQARLIGIGRPYLRDLLAGTTWLDDFVDFHPKSKDRTHHSLGVARRLRAEKLDTAVLFRNSFREAAIAWWAGIPRRVGYRMYWRGPLLTDAIEPPGRNSKTQPYRMVDFYSHLAEHLGCPPESPRLELATTDAEERAADHVWKTLGLRPSDRVVTFNCSGAFGAAKLWPVEHFAMLARRVARELDYDVLVLCGPSERKNAARIAELAAHPRVHSLAGFELSLGLSKACLRRSRLLVTTDSGPRSMAVAFDTPQVSIFGPSWTTWSENPLAREVRLQLKFACVPCMQKVCPLGHHDCMKKLSVGQVMASVISLLERTQSQRLVA
jgi:heptosyltransferase-2